MFYSPKAQHTSDAFGAENFLGLIAINTSLLISEIRVMCWLSGMAIKFGGATYS